MKTKILYFPLGGYFSDEYYKHIGLAPGSSASFIPRHNKDMIKWHEENPDYNYGKIVEIEDDRYYIESDYDGFETLLTPSLMEKIYIRV